MHEHNPVACLNIVINGHRQRNKNDEKTHLASCISLQLTVGSESLGSVAMQQLLIGEDRRHLPVAEINTPVLRF